MPQLDVSDEQLATFVSGAILGVIGEAQRDELLKGAIKLLLTPTAKDRAYGYSSRTPLQEAFDLAIEGTCRTMVRDMLENDPTIQGEIKSLISEAYEKAMENREPLVDTIAGSIARGFREHL